MTTDTNNAPGGVVTEKQAMEVIRKAYGLHFLMARELRKFFLARRGSRGGFSNPPKITDTQFTDFMSIGFIRIIGGPNSMKSGIAPWPMVLECLDKVDQNGRPICADSGNGTIPIPPSSQRDSSPSSSRRFGRPGRPEPDFPVSQAELRALADEGRDDIDDNIDGEVTKLMTRAEMEANLAGFQTFTDESTTS